MYIYENALFSGHLDFHTRSFRSMHIVGDQGWADDNWSTQKDLESMTSNGITK